MANERIRETSQAVRFVIEQAYKDEAHIMVPPAYKRFGSILAERIWERNLGIMEQYLIKGEVGRTIGVDFNLTRSRIEQIAKATFLVLWYRSLLDVREAIHPEALTKLKQSGLDYRRSISPSSYAILDAVSEGQSHAELLSSGFTDKQIYAARRVSNKLPDQPAIPVPKKSSENSRLERDLEGATTDDQKQKLLDLVTTKFYNYLLREGLSLVIPVTYVLAGMELSQNTRNLKKLAAYLTQAEIPNSSFPLRKAPKHHSYYIIHHSDIDRAEQAILKSPEMLALFRNPVSHDAGPIPATLPTTTALGDPKQFFHPASLMRDLGIAPQLLPRLIDDDFPSTIFRYKRGLYAKTKERHTLLDHLTRKAQAAGLIS